MNIRSFPSVRGRPALAGKLRIAVSTVLTLTFVWVGLTAALAGPAGATSSTLEPGQKLTAGQDLAAGPYTLDMQTDGNLVEYDGATVLFASDTSGEPGNWVTMQTDGNLVVYSSSGKWRWQSGTYGLDGAYLALQTDSNLVIYQAGRAIWARSWMETAAGAQAYAQVLFPRYGWSVSGQFGYLNDLWTRESNWRWNVCNGGATYPNCDYSGVAYGIPQADPGSKMAANGPDWATDGLTQVAWGLAYISSVYGDPQAAWAHELAYGWYGPKQ
jgi:hypothetical protein